MMALKAEEVKNNRGMLNPMYILNQALRQVKGLTPEQHASIQEVVESVFSGDFQVRSFQGGSGGGEAAPSL